MPLGMEVGLGPGDIVLDEDPATTQKWAQKSRPLFGPCLLWPSGRPSQQLLSSCYNFLAKAQFISTYFLQICTISCRWFLCFTLFQYRNFWCCRTMLLCLALDSTMVCCSIMSLLWNTLNEIRLLCIMYYISVSQVCWLCLNISCHAGATLYLLNDISALLLCCSISRLTNEWLSKVSRLAWHKLGHFGVISLFPSFEKMYW